MLNWIGFHCWHLIFSLLTMENELHILNHLVHIGERGKRLIDIRHIEVLQNKIVVSHVNLAPTMNEGYCWFFLQSFMVDFREFVIKLTPRGFVCSSISGLLLELFKKFLSSLWVESEDHMLNLTRVLVESIITVTVDGSIWWLNLSSFTVRFDLQISEVEIQGMLQMVLILLI